MVKKEIVSIITARISNDGRMNVRRRRFRETNPRFLAVSASAGTWFLAAFDTGERKSGVRCCQDLRTRLNDSSGLIRNVQDKLCETLRSAAIARSCMVE